MAEKILWKENKAKFNIELSEGEILKRAKKDLIPIQENLTEKKNNNRWCKERTPKN